MATRTRKAAPTRTLQGALSTGPAAPKTKPSGTDGIAAPGGYLWRGERNSSLVGHRLWLSFSDTIANTIVVAAAARYFLNLISGTEWEVEAREEAGSDGKRAADIVREGLLEADMARPWAAIVRKAALYKFYGFSIHEWIVRRRQDGLIVFADIQHRPQYTIQWWDKPTETAPLVGVVQQTRMGNRYYLPRERLLYCVDDTLTDSPDGVGMMRHIIEHADRVKRLEELEGISFENDLRGIPLSRAPIAELQALATANGKGASWVEDQLDPLQQFGEHHVKNANLALTLDSSTYKNPQGDISTVPKWALEILKGDGGPLVDVAKAITRVNLEIARAFGAEFMMMGGESSGGSRAMHEDKTSQFGNLIQATLAEIASYARNDLARTLVALNGLDPDLCTPNLLPGAVSTEAVGQICTALLALAQAGAPLLPGDPAVGQLRKRMHLADQPAMTPDLAGMLPLRPSVPGQPPGQSPPAVDPSVDRGAAPARVDAGDGDDVDPDELDDDASAGLGGSP